MYKLFLDFKILISYHACVFQWSLHSVPEMDARNLGTENWVYVGDTDRCEKYS